MTSITFAQPAPCGPNPQMTSNCIDACAICDIDGFTGTNNLTAQGQGFQEFCTTQFHNMSYIAFIAGTVDLDIEVTVTNCNINWGLEIGIFESFDCANFTPISFCDTDVQPNTTITLSNNVPLVVGQHYYLIMDGSNGDICDWTFNVINGSTAVNALLSSGDISGNSQTCPNFPTTYSTSGAVGAALFFWTIDGVEQTATTQSLDLTFTSDGTYEVCVVAANVCNEAPPTCTTVEVVTPMILDLVEVICDNDCYVVAGDTICDSGIYDFIVTLPNGCDSLIFLDLTVLPQAQEAIDINLCVGEEFFIGTTPYSTTGIHIDTILTTAACDSIVTLDLFMIECEIIGSTDFLPPICNGDANGTLFFSVQNGTPPFTFDYSNILDPTVGGTGSTILFTDNQINNVPAGTYEINIMDDFGNDVVLFQEVTEPPVLTVATEAIDIDGFNLSCNGGMDGTASAMGNGGVPPYAYTWSNTITGDEVTNLFAGTYTVSITDDNGCVQTNNITLTEPTPIEFIVNFIDPNCDGFETGLIQLDSVWGGTAPYDFALDNGAFGSSTTFENLSEGSYSFNIMDDNNCIFDTISSLTAPDIPVLFMGDDLVVGLGCDIVIPVNTNNTNLVDINWISFDNSLDCDTCLRPTANPVNDAQYFLTVTSIDDCTTMDSINIIVDKVRDVFIPNAFSPDSDGYNDFFFINANKSVTLVKKLQVYSRWGGLVYEVTDVAPNDHSTGWDGHLNGKLMNPGVYVWVAELEYLDGEVIQLTGDVTIML